MDVILEERVVATCMFVNAAFTVELSPVESPVFPYACLSKGMHAKEDLQ